MFLICIFALLMHVVFSTTPCKDGVEIVAKETKNPADIIGNWTYVYHWNPYVKFLTDVLGNEALEFECPELHIAPIDPVHVKAKIDQCATFRIPFNWDDAKLRVDAPAMKMDGGIITIGDKENWIMKDCTTIARVVIQKISDDYIMMNTQYMEGNSDLFVREPPSSEELKCISHNLDVDKGMSGIRVCL